jgi:hypothetical protein
MTQAAKGHARKSQKINKKVERLAKVNEEEAKTKETEWLAKEKNERGGRQASPSQDGDKVSKYTLKILLAGYELKSSAL